MTDTTPTTWPSGSSPAPPAAWASSWPGPHSRPATASSAPPATLPRSPPPSASTTTCSPCRWTSPTRPPRRLPSTRPSSAFRSHRHPGQQRRQLLRRLLRGDQRRPVPGADGDQLLRSAQRHPGRAAGHAGPAQRPGRHHHLHRRHRRRRVLRRLRRLQVRPRRMDGVAALRRRSVRHLHHRRRARLLPHRAARRGRLLDLARALHRRLRRAHRADHQGLEGHERPAGRRPRQARPRPRAADGPATSRRCAGSPAPTPWPRSSRRPTSSSPRPTRTASSPPTSTTTTPESRHPAHIKRPTKDTQHEEDPRPRLPNGRPGPERLLEHT